MGAWLLVLAAFVASSLGCDGDDTLVIVDLRTDLRPGLEFSGIRTSPQGRPEVTTFADPRSDYLGGVRIAEVEGLKAGTHSIVVALLDTAGRVVAERPIRVTVSDRVAVTVVITRTCRGISCPMIDAPDLTACLAGMCVDPSCSPETPDTCVTECETDGDCLAPSACSIGRCRDGVCLATPEDDRCGGGQICHPDDGCVDTPAMLDSGPETGPPDVGPDTAMPSDSGFDSDVPDDTSVVSDGAPADVPAICVDMRLQGCGSSGCRCDSGCFCAMACDFSGRCRATCSDAGTFCNLMTQSGSTTDTTLTCTGATCQGTLQGTGTAAVSCLAGSVCDFTCLGGTCDLSCTGASSCLLRCSGGAPCTLASCEGGETSCPGGIVACNRGCP